MYIVHNVCKSKKANKMLGRTICLGLTKQAITCLSLIRRMLSDVRKKQSISSSQTLRGTQIMGGTHSDGLVEPETPNV